MFCGIDRIPWNILRHILHVQFPCGKYPRIIRGTLTVPHDVVMGLNMLCGPYYGLLSLEWMERCFSNVLWCDRFEGMMPTLFGDSLLNMLTLVLGGASPALMSFLVRFLTNLLTNST